MAGNKGFREVQQSGHPVLSLRSSRHVFALPAEALGASASLTFLSAQTHRGSTSSLGSQCDGRPNECPQNRVNIPSAALPLQTVPAETSSLAGSRRAPLSRKPLGGKRGLPAF